MNHQENIATWIKIVFVGFLVDVKMKLAFMMEKMEFAWVNKNFYRVLKKLPPSLSNSTRLDHFFSIFETF